jgi:hypothetical protein
MNVYLSARAGRVRPREEEEEEKEPHSTKKKTTKKKNKKKHRARASAPDWEGGKRWLQRPTGQEETKLNSFET